MCDNVYWHLAEELVPEIRHALRVCRYSYKLRLTRTIKSAAWIKIYRRGECACAMLGCNVDGLTLDLFEKHQMDVTVWRQIKLNSNHRRKLKQSVDFTRSMRERVHHMVVEWSRPDAFELILKALQAHL